MAYVWPPCDWLGWPFPTDYELVTNCTVVHDSNSSIGYSKYCLKLQNPVTQGAGIMRWFNGAQFFFNKTEFECCQVSGEGDGGWRCHMSLSELPNPAAFLLCRDTISAKGCGYSSSPQNLYLEKQRKDWIWPLGHALLTSALWTSLSQLDHLHKHSWC